MSYIFNPEIEQWRDIEGYEGFYQVSSFGRVKSLPRAVRTKGGKYKINNERIIKPWLHTGGYHKVGLSKNGKVKKASVHRLVAFAFIANDDPLTKNLVNHLDHNPSNNHANNLEWTDPTGNMRWAWNHNRCEHVRELARIKGLNSAGEKNGRCKLSDIECIEIIEKYETGKTSHTKLGNEYGVSHSQIRNIVIGKCRKYLQQSA